MAETDPFQQAWMDRVAQMERERDAARAQVEEYRAALDTTADRVRDHAQRLHEARSLLQMYELVMTQDDYTVVQRLARLTRERDEARAEQARLARAVALGESDAS